MIQKSNLPSSFRDPSGFVFRLENILYRQINKGYQQNYEQLIKSGLFEKLVSLGYLVSHQEVETKKYQQTDEAYKVVRPEKIPFISYPYEWSFSQLKDAALLTLEIQKIALEHKISLKDASAYNIQFFNGKPILIDTLSFENYEEGKPWVAYQQFCRHFLAPLALMSIKDVSLGKLLQLHLDGIPLDLASKLLPRHSYLNFSLLLHLHLHSQAQRKYADKVVKTETRAKKFSLNSLLGLIDNLEATIRGLKWKPKGTEWFDYYQVDKNNYLSKSLQHKFDLIGEFIAELKPKIVWDLGGNTGLFSRIASDQGIFTVSSDIDPAAVEINYQTVVEKKEAHLLPLLLDLTNPAPGIGWENQERTSFFDRGPADMVLALALVHHLAISNNVPLENLAALFSSLGQTLIVEFIPKEDSQVQKLLATREDIFPDYTQEGFESAFKKFFSIKKAIKIKESRRILYLMIRKEEK